jgi:6-phosphofructokinase
VLGAYVIRGLKPTAKFNRRYATSLGARASCPQDEM